MREETEQLRYPIGKLEPGRSNRTAQEQIADIRTFPELLARLTASLSEEELALRYRPEGWSVRQVVHHCADSHMNAVIRFKLALTEEIPPTILPYREAEWALLYDTQNVKIQVSLDLLHALHTRWACLLDRMTDDEYDKTYIHPDHPGRVFHLYDARELYSWHCRHHLSHVKLALEGNR